MIFNPKNSSHKNLMITAAQLNHIVFMICFVIYLIWGFTHEFMRGHTENDKNKRCFFIFSIILFIGIACLIKVNIVQVLKLSK